MKKEIGIHFIYIIFTILPFISGEKSPGSTIKIPFNVINYIAFLIVQVPCMYITEHCVRVCITRDVNLADLWVQIYIRGPTTLSEDFCGSIQTAQTYTEKSDSLYLMAVSLNKF